MSIIVRAWAKRYAKPYLTTLHGMLDIWALRNSAWKKRVSGMVYERDCLAKAACIQAFSESEFASARAYGLKNPICIVPNGVDLPGPVSAGSPWADEVHNGKRILLYLGRLHPKKGLLNLLHAWKSIVADCKLAEEWCLVIAGWDQGGHECELKALVATLELESAVHFAGPLFGEAKAAAFDHADAFVLPSFSEGLPMVVLEAWSYGKPVVMTPQCNLAQGFSAGAAISVEPDEDNIAAGLRQLLAAHDDERGAMGARGRNLIQTKFTWPQVARQMHDVYSWLVGGGAAPACVVR